MNDAIRTAAVLGILIVFSAGHFIQAQKAVQESPMTARDYYNELYKAGGLDNFADQYVCFSDDEGPTFFLLANSETLKRFLNAVGGLGKLPSDARKALDKGFLIRTTYNKGVSNYREYFDRDDSGAGYVEDFDRLKPPLTMRLRVNWQTLRYHIDVEQPGVPVPVSDDTGKCEEVKSDIPQRGAESK